MSASYQHAPRRLAYVRSERLSSDVDVLGLGDYACAFVASMRSFRRWVSNGTPSLLFITFFFFCTRYSRTELGLLISVLQGVFGTGKSILAARGGPRRGDAPPFYQRGGLRPAANVAKMYVANPSTMWIVDLGSMRSARPLLRACGISWANSPGAASAGPKTETNDSEVSMGRVLQDQSSERLGAASAAGHKPNAHVFRVFEGRQGGRMQNRKGHYMKAAMSESHSQSNTLESPEDEPGVATVEVEVSMGAGSAGHRDARVVVTCLLVIFCYRYRPVGRV